MEQQRASRSVSGELGVSWLLLLFLSVTANGCSAHASSETGTAAEAVMRSTQIDSAHPYSVLVNSSCTGTVLAGAPGKGSFVLTANHCFDNGEYPIISSPDALAGRNPANYSVTVDFSGDLYDDQGDVHTYTPTGVRTSWYEKNGQTRVDMALLYFAPGVPQPFDLFKENTPHHMKLPRAVTSYLDSATPAD